MHDSTFCGEVATMKSIARFGIIVVAIVAFCASGIGAESAIPQADAASPVDLPVVIPSGHKFIMQLETPLHSRTTRKGDPVEFKTAGDVILDSQVLIPNGSLVRGIISRAKRAGRMLGRAIIELRFTDIKLADGTTLPIKASITRVGFDPVNPQAGEDLKLKGETGAAGDAKTIAAGGAQGAIVGILTGSAKGAMYGAATGAAIAVVGIMLKRGPDLDLPRSTMFEAQFDKPLGIPATAVQAQKAPLAAPETEIQAAANPSEERPAQNPAEVKDSPGEDPGAEVAVADPPPVFPATLPADPPANPPAPSGARAETSAPATGGMKISVNVRMVQVDAVVRDRAGRMIDNLKVGDFRIFEDKVLQEIQSFSQDELPLAVALVIDRSGSVSPYIAELRRIANRALDQLKPQDEVCLFSFAENVDRLEELTTDRRRIADSIDRIRAGGATNIVDALHDSIAYLASIAPGRRHAVILVSDNQHNVSPQASESETIKMAMETETVVYSLKTSGESINLAMQLPSVLFGRDVVEKITRETGGEIIAVKRAASIDAALGTVISRLRLRYSMGYYPTGTAQGGVFHEITIRLAEGHGKPGSDYFIHAKRGYYATAGSLK
jgi:Ca-activated chloride channel homolog